MRIVVQIGEDEQVFDFDIHVVSIGSGPENDIALAYEGIGVEHLKIFQQSNEFFVEDLDSGFKTFINDDVLKPSVPVVFNSFFPVEIGGILISLGDELEKISPNVPDIPVAIPEEPVPAPAEPKVPQNDLQEMIAPSQDNEAPVIDSSDVQFSTGEVDTKIDKNVVEQINEKFEQEHAGEREKFKPNLLADENKTTEFKIDRNNTGSFQRKKLAKKAGTRTKKVKRRKKKNRKEVNTASNFQRFSLSSILIVGFLFAISGYMFYRKQNQKFVKKSNTKVLANRKLSIQDSTLEIVNQHKVMLMQALNSGGCDVAEEICNIIGPTASFDDYESVKVTNDKKLILILRDSRFDKSNPLFDYMESDLPQVDQYVVENYRNIFSLEEFKDNDRKAVLESYRYPVDEYQVAMNFYHRFLDENVIQVLSKANIKEIELYTYTKIGEVFDFKNYVKFPRSSLSFNLNKASMITFKFKTYQSSYLSTDIKDYFLELAQTQYNGYNGKEAKRAALGKRMEKYQSYIGLPKCQEPVIQEPCNEMEFLREDRRAGIAIDDNRMVFLVKSDNLYEKMKPFYEEPYTDKDIRNLLSVYRKVNQKRGLDFSQFEKDWYYEKRLVGTEINSNQAMSVFFFTTALNVFQQEENLTQLLVLGFSNDSIHTVLVFDKEKLKSLNRGSFQDDIRLFWKSNLDTFTPFINKYADEKVLI